MGVTDAFFFPRLHRHAFLPLIRMASRRGDFHVPFKKAPAWLRVHDLHVDGPLVHELLDVAMPAGEPISLPNLNCSTHNRHFFDIKLRSTRQSPNFRNSSVFTRPSFQTMTKQAQSLNQPSPYISTHRSSDRAFSQRDGSTEGPRVAAHAGQSECPKVLRHEEPIWLHQI